MNVQETIEFWLPTEWADHNMDHMFYADLVAKASEAGLFQDLREFSDFYHWKPVNGDTSGHVQAGRLEDGTPFINYHYEVSGRFFSGFFGGLADKMRQMQDDIGFVDLDGVLIMNNLFGNGEQDFLTMAGWVKTTEEVYQAVQKLQVEFLTRLEEDGSAGALEHLTDQGSTPKAV